MSPKGCFHLNDLEFPNQTTRYSVDTQPPDVNLRGILKRNARKKQMWAHQQTKQPVTSDAAVEHIKNIFYNELHIWSRHHLPTSVQKET
ncbi:hypothetical protein C0J52_27718 [Blattella germanica]|nr:hypothetical protein C0J52_27718 [Blattella germanica]